MANSQLLPALMRKGLEESVYAVFSDARRFIEPRIWPSLALRISSEIELAVKAAIATQVAALNGRLSLQNRLPTELWCDIWEQLPFFDRVAVTQVCSHWRRVSLQCPALWSHATFFTSFHATDCACRECRPDLDERANHGSLFSFRGPPAPGWHASPYPRTSSNISLASHIFARSRDLPLHLDLDIVPFSPDRSVLRAFSRHLFPHVSRLASLHVRAACAFSLDMVLTGIDSLPSLRALRLGSLPFPYGWEHFRDVEFLGRRIAFPRLQELLLPNNRNRWPARGLSLEFPAVSSIAFKPDSLKDLVELFRACPAVKFVDINYTSLHRVVVGPKQAEIQELRDLVPHLESLALSETHVLKAPTWIIQALHRRDHRLVSISSESSRSAPPDAPILFRDLGDAVHLSFSRHPVGNMLQGTDGAGMTRRLALAPEKLGFLLQCVDERYLRPDSIVRLTVDASRWQWFVSGVLFAPAVSAIEITIHDVADVMGCTLDAMDTECFPALQRLTIGAGSAVHLSPAAAPAIAEFVRRMGISLPVDTLVLDKRILGLPCYEMIFSGLAHSVLFQ